MSFYFLTEFFKYFFRVLYEASSSWLKLCWFILGHLYMNILAVGCGNALLFILNIIKLIIESERKEFHSEPREYFYFNTCYIEKMCINN
jgi:hypothetical protein